MATVDSAYAQWLMSEASWVARERADMLARWGDNALTTERTTGIATSAAAEAEGDRQLAFLSRGPFAIDEHEIVGVDFDQYLATVIELQIAQLGYDEGIEVFVLETAADHATGISTVAVLRPLGAA